MIVYVDTSSLVKLVVAEQGSEVAASVWRSADQLASSALVVVEARAALAAIRRGGRVSAAGHRMASADLLDLVEEIGLVAVSDEVLAHAADLAEREALRGYDAVHLASALLVGADLVTSADADLCAAAQRQGLHVANPLES